MISDLLRDLKWWGWERPRHLFYRAFPRLCSHKLCGRIWRFGTVNTFCGDRLMRGESEICDMCFTEIKGRRVERIGGVEILTHLK